ncbi:hypothetical protein CH373_15860 [Leptospira perolatii]|uniref:DUF1109 domain-containing protein n=1 Tax=Leptospira perolatii TaxID=2023191 RepID=A0A2M9ZJB9_9LEPT|nr:NrsF family protein [Leptospira perolatii]PJZ68179.1 hypothetical protein CH360_17430 [Leptospira perolatii]PJZ72074.1 hypothetical protein CH373_15860 [Leptospira perolatii]
MQEEKKSRNSGEFIQTLSKELTPVKPLRSGKLFLYWMGVLVFGILLGVAYSLLRPSSAFPGWWPEPFLIACWAILSAAFLSFMVFPEETGTFGIWIAGIGLASWIGFAVLRFVEDVYLSGFHMGHLGACPAILLSMTLVCGAATAFLAKGAAPARPLGTSFLVLSFVLAVSNLVLKFVCPDQSGFHILLVHGLATVFWILVFLFPLRSKIRW